MDQTELFAKASELVQTRIVGFRKGLTEPASVHSFRVAELLRTYQYPDDVILAGLLHDIVEDSSVKFSDLEHFGFSARTIQLVYLCTHDLTIEDPDVRWLKMFTGLIDAQDPDAWAVKLADTTDNVRSCHTLAPDRAWFMRTIKGPLVLHFTRILFDEKGIWLELYNTLKQISVIVDPAAE